MFRIFLVCSPENERVVRQEARVEIVLGFQVGIDIASPTSTTTVHDYKPI
jgi:hypothetical protein